MSHNKLETVEYEGWLPFGGSSHWRRDINSDSTLATYVMLNPLTFTYELSVWRMENSFEVGDIINVILFLITFCLYHFISGKKHDWKDGGSLSSINPPN